LTIQEPEILADKFGTIEDNVLNLGVVPYGKSIKAEILVADPIDECAPFSMDLTGKKKFMILVRRNECPFVAWSIFAQQIGAQALIIVDNKLENTEDFNM
jgi:hypothetical protein